LAWLDLSPPCVGQQPAQPPLGGDGPRNQVRAHASHLRREGRPERHHAVLRQCASSTMVLNASALPAHAVAQIRNMPRERPSDHGRCCRSGRTPLRHGYLRRGAEGRRRIQHRIGNGTSRAASRCPCL